MRFPEWSPLYEEILDDMGYERYSDISAARLLKTIMTNADLIDDALLEDMLDGNVLILGGAPFDVSRMPKDMTVVATGDSIPTLLSNDIIPDIIVTDLDGDVEAQKDASRKGSISVIHAHGDNTDAIMEHASDFTGSVILTTQAEPDNIICNFGGFTDGDRAVCMARHFHSKRIFLMGFDFENPSEKENSNVFIKRKKLRWAERIILSNGKNDIEFL